MPKLYCTHCGQHIDAPNELAGTQAACPTCGGEINIPKLAVLPNSVEKSIKPSTTHANKTNKASKFWSARSLKATGAAAVLLLIWNLVKAETPLERLGLSDRNFVSALAESLGGTFAVGLMALVIALIIAGIMSAFKKRFTKSLSIVYSISILLLTGLALVGNFRSQQSRPEQSRSSDLESARSTISGIEDDIQSLVSDSVGPDGLPRKTSLRFDSNTPASNDMQKLRNLMQSFFNDMIEIQNDYLQALDDDGINTLLDANRVARDSSFRGSRLTLAKAKRTVSKTRSKAAQVMADFPKRTKNYNFSASSDQSFISLV